MTANSFTSVSLTPPLVLWSASLYAQSLSAFQEGSHFVVNILAHDQIELSNKFARSHENKFAEIDHMIPECGAPVLIGAAAHFECRNEYRHYGGDHIIFIGHVERYAYTHQADAPVLPRQIHARRAVDPDLTREQRSPVEKSLNPPTRPFPRAWAGLTGKNLRQEYREDGPAAWSSLDCAPAHDRSAISDCRRLFLHLGLSEGPPQEHVEQARETAA